MKKMRILGLSLLLIGIAYSAYWFATHHQLEQLRHQQWGSLSKQQFQDTYPNLHRAFRFFSYRPYDDDYSSTAMHPGQFIPRHMLRHAFVGIALICLGIGMATFRPRTKFELLSHYVAVVAFGVALTLVFIFHPIVWFWNGK
jgi:hypothetical protein